MSSSRDSETDKKDVVVIQTEETSPTGRVIRQEIKATGPINFTRVKKNGTTTETFSFTPTLTVPASRHTIVSAPTSPRANPPPPYIAAEQLARSLPISHVGNGSLNTTKADLVQIDGAKEATDDQQHLLQSTIAQPLFDVFQDDDGMGLASPAERKSLKTSTSAITHSSAAATASTLSLDSTFIQSGASEHASLAARPGVLIAAEPPEAASRHSDDAIEKEKKSDEEFFDTDNQIVAIEHPDRLISSNVLEPQEEKVVNPITDTLARILDPETIKTLFGEEFLQSESSQLSEAKKPDSTELSDGGYIDLGNGSGVNPNIDQLPEHKLQAQVLERVLGSEVEKYSAKKSTQESVTLLYADGGANFVDITYKEAKQSDMAPHIERHKEGLFDDKNVQGLTGDPDKNEQPVIRLRDIAGSAVKPVLSFTGSAPLAFNALANPGRLNPSQISIAAIASLGTALEIQSYLSGISSQVINTYFGMGTLGDAAHAIVNRMISVGDGAKSFWHLISSDGKPEDREKIIQGLKSLVILWLAGSAGIAMGEIGFVNWGWAGAELAYANAFMSGPLAATTCSYGLETLATRWHTYQKQGFFQYLLTHLKDEADDPRYRYAEDLNKQFEPLFKKEGANRNTALQLIEALLDKIAQDELDSLNYNFSTECNKLLNALNSQQKAQLLKDDDVEKLLNELAPILTQRLISSPKGINPTSGMEYALMGADYLFGAVTALAITVPYGAKYVAGMERIENAMGGSFLAGLPPVVKAVYATAFSARTALYFGQNISARSVLVGAINNITDPTISTTKRIGRALGLGALGVANGLACGSTQNLTTGVLDSTGIGAMIGPVGSQALEITNAMGGCAVNTKVTAAYFFPAPTKSNPVYTSPQPAQQKSLWESFKGIFSSSKEKAEKTKKSGLEAKAPELLDCVKLTSTYIAKNPLSDESAKYLSDKIAKSQVALAKLLAEKLRTALQTKRSKLEKEQPDIGLHTPLLIDTSTLSHAGHFKRPSASTTPTTPPTPPPTAAAGQEPELSSASTLRRSASVPKL